MLNKLLNSWKVGEQSVNNERGEGMKRFIFVLMLVLLFAGLSGVCYSASINGTVTGAEITINYTEPVTNADGSDLLDLDHTNVYYTKDSDGIRVQVTSDNQTGSDINASALTGGGGIEVIFTVPVSPGEDTDISIIATTTDDAENESNDSPTVVLNVDKQAPAAIK